MPLDASDKTILVEPRVRSDVDWTPDKVSQALYMADAGYLCYAADLCEHLISDDRVKSSLGTRAGGLISSPLKFEPPKGGKRTVKALEADEDWWAMSPETELVRLASWAILLGIGFSEKVWTRRKNGRFVPVLKTWHPRHFRLDTDTGEWWVKTGQYGVEERKLSDMPRKWLIYAPFGASRPWAWGAWRAIALWQVLKLFAIRDWGHFSQRHGEGTWVAECPENFGHPKRKELAADLAELDRAGIACLPSGVSLKLVEAFALTYTTFKAQKDAADLGTCVAILGQNLSTEVTGPVGTGATLQGRVLGIYLKQDAETFSTTIHDSQLVEWAEVNYGSPDLAPWPAWNTTPPPTPQEQGATWKALGDGISALVAVSDRVDVDGMLEQAGVKLLAEAPAVPAKRLPPAPPPPPAPPGKPAAKDAPKALLRSGAEAPEGLAEGQAFADAAIEAAKVASADVLEVLLEHFLSAIDRGTTLEEARDELVKAYADDIEDDLQGLVARAFELVQAGGRFSIQRDVGAVAKP